MGTSSARPDDLRRYATSRRDIDDDLNADSTALLTLYDEFLARSRWGHFDAASLLRGFGKYLEWNEIDARWVSQIALAFACAGGDGDLRILPDAAIKASLRAAGLDFDRQHVTFDDPVAYGFPPTTGYADDPVNTASGNFVALESDVSFTGLAAALRFGRVYNSRSERTGAFGTGWSSWADVRLRAGPDGAAYEAPDGQRALFGRMGAGYGRVTGVNVEVEPLGDGLALSWFDGRRWEFDGAGLPLRASHGPGTEIRFGHDGARLMELAHAGGRHIAVRWDGERIVGLESSDGRRVDYDYDADGELTRADATEQSRDYAVAGDGRVTSITDADGVVEVVNDYDEEGRVLRQRSPFGRETVYGYLPGRVTVVADEQGGPPDTYVHDTAGRLLALVDGAGERLSINYDSHGLPVAMTERGGAVTVQEWDERARLRRRVTPAGAVVALDYDDAGRVTAVAMSPGAVTRNAYAGDEQSPVEIVDPEGGLTYLTVRGGLVHRIVDPDGVRTSFEFDDDGNVAAVIDAAGNAARIERDAVGRVRATTTPLGRRTTYDYDERGRLVERRDPAGGEYRFERTPAGRLAAVTDPTGAREEIRYGEHGSPEAEVDSVGHVTARSYDLFGNVARVVAPGGATWQLTYDALSRLTATTDPLGGVWAREYDVDGNQTATIDPAGTRCAAVYDRAGRVAGMSDGLTSSSFELDVLGRALAHRRPDDAELRAEYDRCGRPVAYAHPEGGTTYVEYTPAGRIRRVTSPAGAAESYEYDHCGRVVARTDGEGRRWAFRYDADGALLEQIAPAGEVERFEYDAAGRVTRWLAPGAGVTIYAYDAAGRTIEIADRASGARRFAYDAAGRLASATDANGHTTSFSHDERGRLVAVTDPLGATTTRTYDDLGRLRSETDPLGRTRSLTYDAAGRLVEEDDGSGRRTRWSYDVSGRVEAYGPAGEEPITIARDALGREVEIREPGSYAHELRWDRDGRLVERRRDDLALTWSYDPDGRRAAIGYPDGTRTTYAHDAGGFLVAIQHPSLGVVEFERDGSGRLVGATGNGMQASWEYDDGDLTAYTVQAGDRSRSAVLTRDPIGRVVTALIDGGEQRFAYDDAGQLTYAEAAGGASSFAYDVGGRLRRETSPAGEVDYDYDSAGQLVLRRTGAGATTHYEYDGAGRRTLEERDDVSRRYRWDALGRLTAIEHDERTARVSVDALGELAEVDGAPLLWDTADPIAHLSWLGDRAVIGPGSPWATAGGGEAAWLAPDWQGTTGPSRDPWGAGTPAPSPGPQLGYRGEVELEGDVWLRHRLYAPAARSFVAPDPLPAEPGRAWSANPYAYAGNNPLGASDPLGLRPVTDAELQKYRDQMGRNIWDKGADWFQENWEHVAAAGLVAVGAVLIATGVGGPAGVLLVSGGLSMGMQKATTGKVNPLVLAVELLPVGRVLRVGGAVVGPLRRASGPLAHGVQDLGRKLNPAGLVRRLFHREPTNAVGGTLGPVKPVTPAKRNTGTTVIGHYPEYVKASDTIGARRFDVPESAWRRMTPDEQWAANQRFLDRTIARGDDISLATPLDAARPGSFYERELQYLISKGFRPNELGDRLIAPGG